MASIYCLPIQKAEKFIKELQEGKINPALLSKMSSTNRRGFFEKIVGKENAVEVNTLFESKLLLKNQQQGIIDWAKQVSGLKEPAKQDIFNKVNKLEKILEAKEKDLFLEDLANQRLGINVNYKQAQKLIDIVKSIETKKNSIPENSPIGSKERLSYGQEFASLKEFIEELKLKHDSVSVTEYLTDSKKIITDVSGTAKSLRASLDISVFFRQAYPVLSLNPSIWIDNFLKIWKPIGKELIGKDGMLPIRADIYSRPNALNGKYEAGQFALGLRKSLTEEAFPTSLPGRVPILGRLYKASETGYNGAILRMRADLADRVIAKAEKFGRDTSNPLEMRSLGDLVNSLTGRGNIGRLETFGQEINSALFSIKFLKSNWDKLTAHGTISAKTVGELATGKGLFADRPNITGYARKQAAINLLKMIGTTAAILYTAKTLFPDSVELDIDTRSSNFGKIKIGDTRFDITAGMGSIVTLASRLVPTTHNGELGWWYKSSATNKYTKLASGKFGASDPIDILYQFGEGKASPLFSGLLEIMRQETFEGTKPTVVDSIKKLTVPFSIDNFNELRNNPNAAPIILGVILETLGIGVNTYARPRSKGN